MASDTLSVSLCRYLLSGTLFLIDNALSIAEHRNMFSLRKCRKPGCPAYSFVGTDYCYHHSENKERIHRYVERKLTEENEYRDIYIAAADFRNLTIKKGMRIMGSNFSFCVFDGCIFEDVSMQSVFFDFSLFRNCIFRGDYIRYAVFSGSRFIDTRINDSTVIHSNFMGIDAESSDFSSNDFYFSNFSLSKLSNVSLEDCNLKRTSFRSCITKNVSFRYSNPEEAFFRSEEAGV